VGAEAAVLDAFLAPVAVVVLESEAAEVDVVGSAVVEVVVERHWDEKAVSADPAAVEDSCLAAVQKLFSVHQYTFAAFVAAGVEEAAVDVAVVVVVVLVGRN
jgi:hypothetical protein